MSQSVTRHDGRRPDQLRTISFEANIAPHATGSVLVSFGLTRVICAATIEPNVPTWMKQQKIPGGWLTAEYAMLPYSTLDRKPREISKGKADGRNIEIQRLIGRSLRAVINLQKLGQNTLWLDCDVLQADGGTRTAAITGAYLAARLAVQKLLDARRLPENPITDSVAAVSAGIFGGQPLLDLNYIEDKDAAVDANVAILSDADKCVGREIRSVRRRHGTRRTRHDVVGICGGGGEPRGDVQHPGPVGHRAGGYRDQPRRDHGAGQPVVSEGRDLEAVGNQAFPSRFI